jgi:hypothetical protein
VLFCFSFNFNLGMSPTCQHEVLVKFLKEATSVPLIYKESQRKFSALYNNISLLCSVIKFSRGL